ncbi:MAG: hypothetical protein ACR2GX_01760 [Candidatus Dormibacteria bacterium]
MTGSHEERVPLPAGAKRACLSRLIAGCVYAGTLAAMLPTALSDGVGPIGFHGGSVQHHPQISYVFWGPGWHHDPTGTEKAVTDFAKNLPGSPWQTVLATQFRDASGPVGNDPRLAAIWHDSSLPPKTVSPGDVAGEVQRAVAQNHWSTSADSQIVVFSDQGSVNGDRGSCAYHWYVGSGNSRVAYDYIPFPSAGCHPAGDARFVFANAEKHMLAHEYAETVTDPFLNGWNSNAAEIADACDGNTGSSLPQLWSPGLRECVWSAPHPVGVHLRAVTLRSRSQGSPTRRGAAEPRVRQEVVVQLHDRTPAPGTQDHIIVGSTAVPLTPGHPRFLAIDLSEIRIKGPCRTTTETGPHYAEAICTPTKTGRLTVKVSYLAPLSEARQPVALFVETTAGGTGRAINPITSDGWKTGPQNAMVEVRPTTGVGGL